MSGIGELDQFAKGGPYIGPRGGKYADPKHTIPWRAGADKDGSGKVEVKATPGSKKTVIRESLLVKEYDKGKWEVWVGGNTGVPYFLEDVGPKSTKPQILEIAKKAVEEYNARQKNHEIVGEVKFSKSEDGMSGIGDLESFSKAGPYIGPKGGKWADSKHTIPWKEGKPEGKQAKQPHENWHATHKDTTREQHKALAEKHYNLALDAAKKKTMARKNSNEAWLHTYKKAYHDNLRAAHEAASHGMDNESMRYQIKGHIKSAAEDHAAHERAKVTMEQTKAPDTEIGKTTSGKTVKFLSSANYRDGTHGWSRKDHGDAADVHQAKGDAHMKAARATKNESDHTISDNHTRAGIYHKNMEVAHRSVARGDKPAKDQDKKHPKSKLEDAAHAAEHHGKLGKSEDGMSAIDSLDTFSKGGGPYIGPKGGKWADPKHTIPWKEDGKEEPKGNQVTEKIALANKLKSHIEKEGGSTTAADIVAKTGMSSIDVETAMMSLKELGSPVKRERKDGKLVFSMADPADQPKDKPEDKGKVLSEDHAGQMFRHKVVEGLKAAGIDHKTAKIRDRGGNTEIRLPGAVVHVSISGKKDGKDQEQVRVQGGKFTDKVKDKTYPRTEANIERAIREGLGWVKKSEGDMSAIDNLETFAKGGPYIGPRGGKWADPEHKIPWAADQKAREKTGGKKGGKAWPRHTDEHVDQHAVTELDLYAENDYELYKQRESFEANVVKKMASGNYDHAQAPQLWQYFADRVAKKYEKEHGGNFDKPTRQALARKMAGDFHDEVKANPDEYKKHVPKKYQKDWGKKSKAKKSEDTMSDDLNKALPTGQPTMGGSGAEQGGNLAGVGKTSGSIDSSSGPPVNAPKSKKDKLSEDDEDENKQMTAHKKPIERTTRKSLPQDQRDMVARENAVAAAELRKGQDDVEAGVGVAPPQAPAPEAAPKGVVMTQGPDAMVAVSTSADEVASRLAKGEDFYHGGDPTLTRQVAILSDMKSCPACSATLAKSLAVCPDCGAGAPVHRVMPGVIMGDNDGEALSKSRPGGLQPARGVGDLYLPDGVVDDE